MLLRDAVRRHGFAEKRRDHAFGCIGATGSPRNSEEGCPALTLLDRRGDGDSTPLGEAPTIPRPQKCEHRTASDQLGERVGDNRDMGSRRSDQSRGTDSLRSLGGCGAEAEAR